MSGLGRGVGKTAQSNLCMASLPLLHVTPNQVLMMLR